MHEQIFRQLERDFLDGGWHHPFHHPSDPAPAGHDPQETAVSFVTDVETAVHDLADHARKVEQEVLPAALATAKKLETVADNPLVASLLKAVGVGVPAEMIDPLVAMLEALVTAYGPDTSQASPAPAAPVADPAPADPSVPAAA